MATCEHSLRAAIRHGFDALNLNRIEADLDPRNIGSARVLEKLGLLHRARRDGRHREPRAAQALLGRALSSPAGRIRPAAPSRPGSTGGRRGPRSPGHT
ncbi:GNAT family N-acetyltransferase [Pyxidicoccus trucidator]|uniref:GNAT family N-acetyltransferase n=1 Tax=Pyxidicoccus trucidator TaxID=2709662 RepID=UPI0013D92164